MSRFIPRQTPKELHAIQENGLRWTVLHAYSHSPQYRKKFQDAGINPTDIQKLEDITSLPFTTVDDLRDGYPFPLLSVPESKVVRIHASSGTTGKRKILAYTQKDVDTFTLQMARCFELVGLTPQDRVQIAVGYGLWTAGVGFQLGCEAYGSLAVPVGAGNLEMHLQMLTDVGSTCLCSTASMALLMGEEIQRHGLQDSVALKKVIFGAEGHTPKMRKAFEEALRIEESFDIGGMTESYGPGSSIECSEHNGLHYWGDLFIYEIVDPETLQPVAPGEIGELVITTLCKEAVPLIRYRTRDLTRFIPEACPCGCTMPRHDHLVGRSDDMFVFRGVNIYPGQIGTLLGQVAECGAEYHIQLTREGGRDNMLLQIERAEKISSDADEKLAERVKLLLSKHVLVSATVEVAEPFTLPRSFGKSRRVTDQRV